MAARHFHDLQLCDTQCLHPVALGYEAAELGRESLKAPFSTSVDCGPSVRGQLHDSSLVPCHVWPSRQSEVWVVGTGMGLVAARLGDTTGADSGSGNSCRLDLLPDCRAQPAPVVVLFLAGNHPDFCVSDFYCARRYRPSVLQVRAIGVQKSRTRRSYSASLATWRTRHPTRPDVRHAGQYQADWAQRLRHGLWSYQAGGGLGYSDSAVHNT